MTGELSGPPPDRPMRVLHLIVPEPEGSVGGADMHVRDLAAAQLRRGATKPTVFETLSPSFARRVRDTGVECVSLAGRPKRHILPALWRVISERRIDVVHAHGYDATWWAVASVMTARRRPALVVTCHGWIETSVKLRIMSALDRAATRLASGIIVVSDELVAPALNLAGRASVFATVPNGVVVGRLRDGAALRRRLGLPACRPLVGAIGRLSAEKRHDVFVDACALVSVSVPDAHFVLAGGGPLRGELEARAAKAGIADRFHMVGVVDEPEALLHECDVVVQPSDIETTSRVVLEAMVQERPVVATRVGGMASLIKDRVDGILVPRRCPQAIASEVVRLLDEPAAAARLGTAARRAVAGAFDIMRMAACVEDVYGALFGRALATQRTWRRPPAGRDGIRPKLMGVRVGRRDSEA